jgi:amiloride-sensitive sodium channel
MEDEFKLSYYDYYTSWNCLDECIANITFKKCGCVRYYMPRDHKRAICGPEKKLYDCAENVKSE